MNQTYTRRTFVTSGLGAALATGLPGRAAAAEPTAQERANVQVVNDFCAAFSGQNLATITSFLADDGVYRMTETAEPVKGREAIAARLSGIVGRISHFDVLDTFARGPMVVNERVDHFTSGQMRAWHGVGVFFLKDGKIVEWLDYTISTERG